MHTPNPSAQQGAINLDTSLDAFVAQLEPSYVHAITDLLKLAGKPITADQMQAALVRAGYQRTKGRIPYSAEICHGWDKQPSAHACTKITFEINSDQLDGYTDEYIAQLWHISQANPAPFGDRQACELAERIGREIIRRFVSSQPPALWKHQGQHVLTQVRIATEYEALAVADIVERLQAHVLPGEVITLDEVNSRLKLPDEPGMQGRLSSALRCAGFTRDRLRLGDHLLWAWKAPSEPHRPGSPGEPPAALCTHQEQPGACDQCSHQSAAPTPEAQQQPDSSPAQKAPHQSALPSHSPLVVGGSVSSTEGGAA